MKTGEENELSEKTRVVDHRIDRKLERCQNGQNE